MKEFTEQDQRITREFGRYRLAPPSPDLHDRILLSAREAMAHGDAELHWTGRWVRACGAFRQEILAFASALMLILGVVIQLGGSQSVLADSIERWQVMATVSGSLHRATSMDCTVMNPSAGDEISRYRVRWNAGGVTRVDRNAINGAEKTLWISKGNVSVADDEDGAVRSMTVATMPTQWQLPMELLTPAMLAQHMGRYGLMQAEHQQRERSDELILVGQSGQQAIEIAIDVETYLPKTITKHLPTSGRTGKERDYLEEVRFQWNKPIPRELFVPGASAAKRQLH